MTIIIKIISLHIVLFLLLENIKAGLNLLGNKQ